MKNHAAFLGVLRLENLLNLYILLIKLHFPTYYMTYVPGDRLLEPSYLSFSHNLTTVLEKEHLIIVYKNEWLCTN